MEIPSGFVYAALPLIASGILWIAKQFIRSNVRRTDTEPAAAPRRRTSDQPPPEEPAPPHKGMSVREYMEISDLLKRELAGRYMEAEEARERFEQLEHKLDKISVHIYQSQQRRPRTAEASPASQPASCTPNE
jgi:hypothetical protein